MCEHFSSSFHHSRSTASSVAIDVILLFPMMIFHFYRSLFTLHCVSLWSIVTLHPPCQVRTVHGDRCDTLLTCTHLGQFDHFISFRFLVCCQEALMVVRRLVTTPMADHYWKSKKIINACNVMYVNRCTLDEKAALLRH